MGPKDVSKNAMNMIDGSKMIPFLTLLILDFNIQNFLRKIPFSPKLLFLFPGLIW